MATRSKSRVSKQNNTQLTQFKFRWWMALVLIGVVAIIGIVILRFSHASGKVYVGRVSYVNRNQGALTVNINGMGNVNLVQYQGNIINGNIPGWSQNYLGWCATVHRGGAKDTGNVYDVHVGDSVFVSVYDGKDANSCYGTASIN